ncbi:MAG: phosphoribosyltransferase [Candidatus Bathyarchaeota archaeon]|nr:phosphoribosyltransferase [Candidatus Bathyarchaeota archaeon]
MENSAEFEVVTWERAYDMLLRQAEKIRQSNFKPEVIVGIAKGGWIPARVLSDLLEISVLATVQVEFYVGIAKSRAEPVLKQKVAAMLTGKKVLLVDDVADTGKSLQFARAHVLQRGAAEVRIATLYKKPESAVKPDYYEAETSRWVVFPWEVKETIRKIVEKHREKGVINAEIAKLVKADLPKKIAERFLKEILEERKC